MGASCSRGVRRKNELFTFMLQGYRGSGKTSIIRRMTNREIGEYWPTHSVEGDILNYEGEQMHAWDWGERERIRVFYRMQHQQCDGLIYVIDSADRDNLDDALEELQDLILQSEDLAKKVVMVAASKQDLENAMTAEEMEGLVKEKCRIGQGMTVFVMPCSAVTSEGLWEAFAHFVRLVKNKKQKELKVPVGLIPRVWETANQVSENNPNDEVKVTTEKGVETEGTGVLLHKLKNSKLKDPIGFLKSVLFH